jgi:hypothetical protein
MSKQHAGNATFSSYSILELLHTKGMFMAQDTPHKSFKDTLNLPHTDFPIRAQPKIEDPELIARWLHEDLFGKSFELNRGNTSYILHDGPPLCKWTHSSWPCV